MSISKEFTYYPIDKKSWFSSERSWQIVGPNDEKLGRLHGVKEDFVKQTCYGLGLAYLIGYNEGLKDGRKGV